MQISSHECGFFPSVKIIQSYGVTSFMFISKTANEQGSVFFLKQGQFSYIYKSRRNRFVLVIVSYDFSSLSSM